MTFISDLKYATRLLSKKPGFTILTATVMAVGIGLSLYLFSLFNTILFKPLPFENGESLVRIASMQNGVKGSGEPLNLHDYHELRSGLKGMSEFGAYRIDNLNVSGRDGIRRYTAVSAEPNIFRITRTKPIIGREYTDSENRVGAENVVVIGYDLWQNQFSGSQQVIDQKLRVNGESYRIIGVMPKGYFFPGTADMWIPLRQDATKINRGKGKQVYGIAHINDGVKLDEVNRQLTLIMKRVEQTYPKTNRGISAFADSLQMSAVADAIVMVYAMQVIAILILILASINVGNLLLARAIERAKETAIRVALGAPRSRLISQMLWESIIICTLGGIIGLAGLVWGLEITETITAAFSLGKLPFWWKFGIDAFAIKLFISFIILTVFMTGFLPAWKNSGADFNTVLRDGTRGALGKKAGRLNRLLVSTEIFLSMTVMIIVGVIVMGSYLESDVDYGAQTDNILIAKVNLPEANYVTPESKTQFTNTLQSHLESRSDVGKVAMFSAIPGAVTMTPSVAIEGQEYTQDRGYPRANYIIVTTGSLSKLGVELKHGRYFNSSDDSLDNSTAVVTDSFASKHFPNESAIGKRIQVIEEESQNNNWLTIVGVVEHTIQGTASSDSGKMASVFRAYGQAPIYQMTIALEMKTEIPAAIKTLRTTLQSIDPELPAFHIETYKDGLSRITAPSNFMSGVLLLFGITAVIFATSGIYGVMSNTIIQRTQEIGVKRALGATEQRITREFLMAGFKQLLWGGLPGLLIGCSMAFMMSKTIGIENTSVIIIATLIISVISSVVMFATYIPTKRALKLEPSDALHYE